MRRFGVTPSNVIAGLALFFALGGISYAASTLPNNSVGTKQIKKNGVTASDIKKNAVAASEIKKNGVSSSEIKDNSVKGAEVDESSLGQVPSAATAGTASDQFVAARRVLSSATDNDPLVARAAATEIPLASNGTVSLYGKCFSDTDGDEVWGEIFARSSANGSLLESDDDDLDGSPTYLNTSTAEEERQVSSTTASADDSNEDGDTHSEVQLIGADGVGMFAGQHVWMKNGTLVEGNGAFTGTDACIFMVQGTKIAAS